MWAYKFADDSEFDDQVLRGDEGAAQGIGCCHQFHP